MAAADDEIRRHYQQQAELHGGSGNSTMEDVVIRAKELALLARVVQRLSVRAAGKSLRILEVGCGNGFALAELAARFPQHQYTGLDFTPELLAIARERRLSNCHLLQGDARELPFETAGFDLVYTERCLINIMDWSGQCQALAELARVTPPLGHALFIECFTDGMENNNRARTECGLPELAPAHHNLYFGKAEFLRAVAETFRVVEPAELDPDHPEEVSPNFLSSHYFIARVLHPLTTKGEWVRNTEFVKFFSGLPPMGNYSPIQAYVLERI